MRDSPRVILKKTDHDLAADYSKAISKAVMGLPAPVMLAELTVAMCLQLARILANVERDVSDDAAVDLHAQIGETIGEMVDSIAQMGGTDDISRVEVRFE